LPAPGLASRPWLVGRAAAAHHEAAADPRRLGHRQRQATGGSRLIRAAVACRTCKAVARGWFATNTAYLFVTALGKLAFFQRISFPPRSPVACYRNARTLRGRCKNGTGR